MHIYLYDYFMRSYCLTFIGFGFFLYLKLLVNFVGALHLLCFLSVGPLPSHPLRPYA